MQLSGFIQFLISYPFLRQGAHSLAKNEVFPANVSCGHSLGRPSRPTQNRKPEMKFYTKIQALINSVRTDEEGATAVEYGLMVSLIAVVIIGAVALIGTNLNTMFGNVAGKIKIT